MAFSTINTSEYPRLASSFNGAFATTSNLSLPPIFSFMKFSTLWNKFFTSNTNWDNGFSYNLNYQPPVTQGYAYNSDISAPLFDNQSYSSTGSKKISLSKYLEIDEPRYERPRQRRPMYEGPLSGISYANLSKSEAITRARKDSNLEELTSGKGWKICEGSFRNDIPYAKKGTGAILTKVSRLVGQQLIVTSALGTKGSPHEGEEQNIGHYNPNNPKLDFGGGMDYDAAKSLAKRLMATGYFEFAIEEDHGSGWHVDAKIKDSAYRDFTAVA